MDQTTRDKIARDNAYHRATLRRQAEQFEQDLEHRRIMLGLQRFHEFEMTRIRKLAEPPTQQSPNTKQTELEPSQKRPYITTPKGTLFKQIAEDGSAILEPMYLRVVWVDSDCGGFFRWTNERPVGNDETISDAASQTTEVEMTKDIKITVNDEMSP